MRLNKNSWHYKMWAGSYFSKEEVPYSTDLCRYCHRVFWQLVLRAFMAFAVCLMLGMGGFLLFYKGLYQNTLTTVTILGVVAAVITALVLYVKWINGKRSFHEPKTLVGKYAQAAKQGICPLVQFNEED